MANADVNYYYRVSNSIFYGRIWMSDLRFVEWVVREVAYNLDARSRKCKDVEIAARYLFLARAFPLTFLTWAAGQTSPLEEAASHANAPSTSLRATFDNQPLLANLLKAFDGTVPFQSSVTTASLPPICIEALVIYNSKGEEPTNEAENLARERTINEMFEKIHTEWRERRAAEQAAYLKTAYSQQAKQYRQAQTQLANQYQIQNYKSRMPTTYTYTDWDDSSMASDMTDSSAAGNLDIGTLTKLKKILGL